VFVGQRLQRGDGSVRFHISMIPELSNHGKPG
jgi:hypothetical protein